LHQLRSFSTTAAISVITRDKEVVSVEITDDIGDIDDDPDEIQTEGQKRTKVVLSIDRKRKLYRESRKVRNIASDEDNHVTPLDARKTSYRKERDFCLDQKNQSCDASFGRHTCNLSRNNIYRDLTKNKDNRNVKLYMDETSLFYGANMHRQYSLQ
jgi:hypothetical protein